MGGDATGMRTETAHAMPLLGRMIWEIGGKSLRESGELFGGMDYATVAQRIRRTRSSRSRRTLINRGNHATVAVPRWRKNPR